MLDQGWFLCVGLFRLFASQKKRREGFRRLASLKWAHSRIRDPRLCRCGWRKVQTSMGNVNADEDEIDALYEYGGNRVCILYHTFDGTMYTNEHIRVNLSPPTLPIAHKISKAVLSPAAIHNSQYRTFNHLPEATNPPSTVTKERKHV